MELKLNGALRAFADYIAFFTQTLLILLKENLHILRNYWGLFDYNVNKTKYLNFFKDFDFVSD